MVRKGKPDRMPKKPVGTTKDELGTVGVKFDTDKPRYDLLPWLALECVAVVMRDGAEKYDEHNWRRGLHWSRLLRGAIGHISKTLIGEWYDPGTKLPHLAHAACCILFVLEYFLLSRVDGRYDKWNNLLNHGEEVHKEYELMDSYRDPKTRRNPM